MNGTNTNKSRKRVFVLLLFVFPSLLCLGFYFFSIRKPLSSGKNSLFIKLPYLKIGESGLNDSVAFTLANCGVNSLQKELTSVGGEQSFFYLLHFYCNECDEESRQTMALLLTAKEKLNYLKKQFRILSVPDLPADTIIERRKAAMAKVHAEMPLWQFIVPKTKMCFEVFKKYSKAGSLHSKVFLIDKKGFVRGVYAGNKMDDTKRMTDEVVVLAAEYGTIKNMKQK